MSGESKQIDEDENGPENGGMKSGPCLIAGFHALSCTSPSYYNPYRGVNKNTLSVDMVRLSLTFKGDRGEWLSRKGAQLTDCDEMSAWTSKIRPGGWYELWSFALGGSSVALGIGFMEPSCKVHMHAPFTPILDGRFNYKQMCPRSFYQSMHKELGDYLERCLGYRPEVELGEDTRARRVYTDKSVDIDRVRGAVDKAVVEPAQQEAERIVAAARAQAATIVRDAEMRKAELVTQIAGKEGDLAELDSRLSDVRMDIEDEQDRLECLRQRAGGVARDVEELRPIAAEVRGWEAAGKAERGTILDSIAARCAGAARAARAAIEELGDRIWALMRPRKAQRGERSLDDVMREATEAARASEALGRNHAAPQRTYRGRAR